MKVKTVFIWLGKPPKCMKVKGNVIDDQSIFQNALADPMKGHLWDLEKNKCLVHENCDCQLAVHFTAEVVLSGTVQRVREYAKKLKKLEEEFYFKK